MLLALVLSSTPALATTDIGSEKKFGIGVASGAPIFGVTGKFWLSDKSGIAAYLGTSGFQHTARVAFQAPIHTWGEEWSWGELPLYWHVDAEAGLWSYLGYSGARIGAGAGVGIALQFSSVPIELFTEVGLGVFPINGYCDTLLSGTGLGAACLVNGMGAAGGRWYF